MTTEINPQPQEAKTYESEINLYTVLVDQLLKYDSLIWQLPTALVIGNFVAIEKFLTKPLPLLALAVFNFGLIFAFHRMIKSQRQIMKATQKAEDELRAHYPAFLPTFPIKHKIPAPALFTMVLSLLELGLVAYVVILIAFPR